MNEFKYLDLGIIDYQEALTIQTSLFDSLVKQKLNREFGLFSQLFLCEHTPVLTSGKSGKDCNLLVTNEWLQAKGINFYHINRGGDITYHGPGQIVGYPVFDLELYGLGLKQYVHLLEEIIIELLATFGLKGERLDGATGVWLDASKKGEARKICAIGVKSSRYITMHGFALNVNTDLDAFSLINPCGFIDKGVTSLKKELGLELDIQELKHQLVTIFRERFR